MGTSFTSASQMFLIGRNGSFRGRFLTLDDAVDQRFDQDPMSLNVGDGGLFYKSAALLKSEK